MSVSIVVGSQWGDEGKAKVIDFLASRSDLVIRFQGGANAGHTVIVNDDKFVFHLVPSGIMYPHTVNLIGNGVVFDPEQFLSEVGELGAKGINLDNRLFVSDLAHLVLPWHKLQDQFGESQAAEQKIGTTGRGIGPAYADKMARTGIRVGDLMRTDVFTARMASNYARYTTIFKALYNQRMTFSLEEAVEKYNAIADRIRPFVIDTSEYIHAALRQNKRVLFEGAQGAMLDIDHGTYPFVTSSNTITGSVCTGAGLGPTAVGQVIGIVKAYTTRVGNGPFPTECLDAVGEKLRAKGGEYGATTGRPRRCGWFDSVLLRKVVQLTGMTHIALTKLDVLSDFDEIAVCTHYEINGKKREQFPSIIAATDTITPVYEQLPGWQCDITGCVSFGDLPSKAQAYVRRLQKLCYEVPLMMVSVGPDRSQTIAEGLGQ